jgi:opacity protein-like surface antigen
MKRIEKAVFHLCVLFSALGSLAQAADVIPTQKTPMAVPSPRMPQKPPGRGGIVVGKDGTRKFLAELRRGDNGAKRIDQLSLRQEGAWFELSEQVVSGNRRRWGVDFTLDYRRIGGSLAPLQSNYRLRRDAAKPELYQIFVPVTGKQTKFKIFAVLPTGEVVDEEFILTVPAWETFVKSNALAAETKKKRLGSEQRSFSLGYTSLQYQESGTEEIAASLLTLKGGASGDLGKLLTGKKQGTPWGWGLMGYITLIPIKMTIDTATMRFVGFNARVSYAVPVPQPWFLKVSLGYYYTTMLVNAVDDVSRFGFQNQMGPQLMPAFGRELGIGRSVSGYVKVAPIVDGLKITDFTSRELAWGIAFSQVLRPGLAASISFDQAWLRTAIQSSSVTSNTQSFSLGLVFAGD